MRYFFSKYVGRVASENVKPRKGIARIYAHKFTHTHTNKHIYIVRIIAG